jgi:hypothetical protein
VDVAKSVPGARCGRSRKWRLGSLTLRPTAGSLDEARVLLVGEDGRVGGADGDQDQDDAHEEGPHGQPVRARADALDGAARRAVTVELDALARDRWGRHGPAADLDRASGRDGAALDVRTTPRRERADDLDIALAVTDLVAALRDVAGTAVARGAAIGHVSTATCFLRPFMDISEMLYVGPPSGGVDVSHVILTLFPWRPTG